MFDGDTELGGVADIMGCEVSACETWIGSPHKPAAEHLTSACDHFIGSIHYINVSAYI